MSRLLPVPGGDLRKGQGKAKGYRLGPALLLALAAVLVVAGPARADIISTFDSDDDGWVVANFPGSLGNPPPLLGTFTPTFKSTGGNPAGYIEILDPTPYDWFFFSAPDKFLGDQSRHFGDYLCFDLFATGNDGEEYPAVALIGANEMTLYYNTPPPGTDWTSYLIPLSPEGWKVGDYETGDEPTEAEMMAVMLDLAALYIDGDWLTNPETSGIDNVAFCQETDHDVQHSPEPGSMVLFGLGVAGLAGWVSRRKKPVVGQPA